MSTLPSASRVPPSPLTDRDVQDDVIRFLTDADLRVQASCGELFTQADSERAGRFSRFLARRYYRDRLYRGFRYSAALVPESHRADQIVDEPRFDSVLAECDLGSLGTAQAVGGMAVASLKPVRQDLWWRELLEYERAFFIQLAVSEPEARCAFPQKGRSTLVGAFSFRIPELLESLRSREASSESFQGKIALLFSRTPHGKIYVAELDRAMRSILESIDGASTVDDIAQSVGISPEEARHSLSRLAEFGAVVMPTADH